MVTDRSSLTGELDDLIEQQICTLKQDAKNLVRKSANNCVTVIQKSKGYCEKPLRWQSAA